MGRGSCPPCPNEGAGVYRRPFFVVMWRKWDEIPKKRLLWLYYHSPILLLGFSYDAYMMLLSCSYVGG